MIGFCHLATFFVPSIIYKGGQVTKPIIVVKIPCELLYIIQVYNHSLLIALALFYSQAVTEVYINRYYSYKQVTLYKQKQPGCKKSARPIRSHNGYKRPKSLILSKAKKLNILLRILLLE